jgi:hypothetical protein
LTRKHKVDQIVDEAIVAGNFLRHALHRRKVHAGTVVLIDAAKGAIQRLLAHRRKEARSRVPITRAQLNAMVRLHEAGILWLTDLKNVAMTSIWRPLLHAGLVGTDCTIAQKGGLCSHLFLTEFGLNELGHRGLIGSPEQEAD